MDIKGKVAVITGSARGIGKEYARDILNKGGKVVIADVLTDIGLGTEKEFQDKYGPGNVIFVHTDVSDENSRKGVFDKCLSTFGYVDILINNAAIAAQGIPIEKVFAVNVIGLMECTYMAASIMDKRKGGKGGVIVNISSLAALETAVSSPEYHATKAGVLAFTRSYGESALGLGEYRAHGVRLMCLCPSYVKTDMTGCWWDPEYKAQDDPGLKDIEARGGWVSLPSIVSTCMSAIEQQIPQSSAIKILPKESTFVYPPSMENKLFLKFS